MKTITKHITTDVGEVFVSYRPSKESLKGSTLVFLHGWGSDHRVFSEVVRASRSATLSIDLPGFGQSSLPTRSLTVADVADVVTEAVEKCELSKVILVGHSFGGQVVTALAARKPQWLEGLVLVGAASLRETDPPLLSRLGGKLAPVFRLPILRKLRPALYRLIGADLPPENPVMCETMRSILRDDQRAKLSEIAVPTQVIWGSRDRSTPLAEGEEIARRLPHSVLTVLDGGHYIFLDQPTAFADTLFSFVKRIS
ncbi:MAG: alpha/beta hydrolase [Candidatus Paceibacterota bacterium]